MRYQGFICVAATVAAFLALVAVARSEVVTDSAVQVVVGGGHGSGVYIGDGYILTAAHVAVEAGTEGTVEIKHPRSENYADSWTATVVWVDTRQDVALLHVKAVISDTALKASPVSCDKFNVGQKVVIVGWPRDLGRIQSSGYIASDETKRGPWAHSVVVVAPVTFGNSGGPVYDEQTGKVAGIAVGILDGTSLSLVVPVYHVCGTLPRSINTEK